ncbi:MAG: alpha/beta hydrolase [Acidimicrobiales bacterium]
MRQRYVTTNGIRMFCVEEGTGPLVLLVHGFPEFWWSWRNQLPALAAAGYRAVAVDLPGYGRSDKPARATYEEPWLNECLAGVVEALGAEQCVIVGHDWGGLLVWPFARRFPERTAGVVGLNTPDLPRGTMPPLEVMAHVFGDKPNYIMQFQPYGPADFILSLDIRAFLDAMFAGPATVQHRAFPPEVVAEYEAQFAPLGAITPPLQYYRAMDANWHHAASLPERIDAPALMVCAESDPVLRPEMSEGMEERVAHLSRALINDCGHWTQQEQPEATNIALLGFLDGLPRWR